MVNVPKGRKMTIKEEIGDPAFLGESFRVADTLLSDFFGVSSFGEQGN